jgi:hypothetical protein
MRTLLFQASMPPTFWVDALHTATYLMNRHPTKTLHLGTPYFALYGVHPDYSHLRVSGCLCYPNLSSTAANKLSPRSAMCVFLGYPPEHKGYRCLDLSTNRVIISRHVIFNGSTFPFANRAAPPVSSDFDFLADMEHSVPPIGRRTTRHPATPVGSPPQAAASGTAATDQGPGAPPVVPDDAAPTGVGTAPDSPGTPASPPTPAATPCRCMPHPHRVPTRLPLLSRRSLPHELAQLHQSMSLLCRRRIPCAHVPRLGSKFQYNGFSCMPLLCLRSRRPSAVPSPIQIGAPR